jgi:hypothetical protein
MFPPWRFKLREAQVALAQGRLEEAADLVGQPHLRSYLPVQQATVQIGEQLARRALERAASGDFSGAWRDLDQARQIAGETADWQRLSQAVAEVALGDVVQHLAASDFPGAQSRLEILDKRKLPGIALAPLREVAKHLESARKLSQRGRFAEAEDQLVAASALRPDLSLIEDKRQTCRQRAEKARLLTEQLHAAIAANDWTKVVTVSNELLEISPENRVARDARKRAWEKVGSPVVDSRHVAETQHWGGINAPERADARQGEQVASPAPWSKANDHPASRSRRETTRFLLWIDAVGGYLVCLADEITIGQATPGSTADIAIQADLSRQHARLVRHAEGYLLECLGKVAINGKPATGTVLLSDGDELLIGHAVKMLFRKPHVLSSSARLEITSGHRTAPYADGFILMAESCVLGPKWQNHVICRDWANDVVLYRGDGKIMCRAMESIEIDGKLYDGRGPVQPGSHVVGSDFSLSLEGA